MKDRSGSHKNRERKAGTMHSHVSALDPEACMEEYGGETGTVSVLKKNPAGFFFLPALNPKSPFPISLKMNVMLMPVCL